MQASHDKWFFDLPTENMSTFDRVVEVGRVALVSYGPYLNRLVVIVDIIDHNRALVDGPTTKVPRHALSFRRMVLTPLTVKIPRGVRTGTLKKVLEKEEVTEKFAKSAWGQKLQRRHVRQGLTDLERFKLMRLKKQKRQLVNVQLAKLKKQKA